MHVVTKSAISGQRMTSWRVHHGQGASGAGVGGRCVTAVRRPGVNPGRPGDWLAALRAIESASAVAAEALLERRSSGRGYRPRTSARARPAAASIADLARVQVARQLRDVVLVVPRGRAHGRARAGSISGPQTTSPDHEQQVDRRDDHARCRRRARTTGPS